ncbi:MAG: T9SS type A sorting domain-containing protein [Bacteroidota bacterium]
MKNLYLLLAAALMIVSQSLFAQGPQTEICIATVNEASSHNIIVWDRDDQVSADPIDSIRIYRDDGQNTYNLIATVDYDNLSEFQDLSANPNAQSYSYKIQGVDVNGVAGPLSARASTIHLTLEEVNGELGLYWTDYEGSTPFNYYRCWEIFDLSTNDKDLINSTQGMNTTDWLYTNADTSLSYEIMVDMDELSTPCQSTKEDYNTPRSNRSIFNPGGGTSSVDENSIQNIKLYPNPSNGNTTLTLSSTVWKNIDVKIVDISGKTVAKVEPMKVLGQSNIDLPTQGLEQGIYNVVINNGIKHVERLVIN